jgi:hypothetical protein
MLVLPPVLRHRQHPLETLLALCAVTLLDNKIRSLPEPFQVVMVPACTCWRVFVFGTCHAIETFTAVWYHIYIHRGVFGLLLMEERSHARPTFSCALILKRWFDGPLTQINCLSAFSALEYIRDLCSGGFRCVRLIALRLDLLPVLAFSHPPAHCCPLPFLAHGAS